VSRSGAGPIVDQRGARVLADYDGFQVIETDEAPRRRWVATVPSLLITMISSGFGQVAEHAGAETGRCAGQRRVCGRRLHLVHFVGPVKPAWRGARTNRGQDRQLLPQNAYLVYGDTAALERMQSWAGVESFVQWRAASGRLQIHPRARSVDGKGNLRATGRAPSPFN